MLGVGRDGHMSQANIYIYILYIYIYLVCDDHT